VFFLILPLQKPPFNLLKVSIPHNSSKRIMFKLLAHCSNLFWLWISSRPRHGETRIIRIPYTLTQSCLYRDCRYGNTIALCGSFGEGLHYFTLRNRNRKREYLTHIKQTGTIFKTVLFTAQLRTNVSKNTR